jgi:hypothetical protein
LVPILINRIVLSIYSIAKTYLGKGWAIHPLSGSLLKFAESDLVKFKSTQIPPKVLLALDFCNNPYKLSPPIYFDESIACYNDKKIESVYRKLSYLRRKSFFLSIIYAGIRKKLYPDSISAMNALARILPSHDSEACLQRALTVAKTSKKFKSHGVLFIGAQLPLKSLHAWIIEDGVQPDAQDRQWINFLPLIALTYR